MDELTVKRYHRSLLCDFKDNYLPSMQFLRLFVLCVSAWDTSDTRGYARD